MRKQRTVHGTTNHRTQHLCRMPNPSETVNKMTIGEYPHDVRGLNRELKDSLVSTAHDHVQRGHKSAPPPALPKPGELYKQLNSAPIVADGRPAFGLTGALPSPDGSRMNDVYKPERLAPVSEPRNRNLHDGFSMKEIKGRVPWESTPRSAVGPPSVVSAAPSSTFGSLPNPPEHYRRGGNNNASTTFSLMQPEHNTALYIPPKAQFDPSSRGLASSLQPQLDKLRAAAAKEEKSRIRREKEAAVVASRKAEGDKALRLDENRIKSKALQLETYKQRLSAYKFTA